MRLVPPVSDSSSSYNLLQKTRIDLLDETRRICFYLRSIGENGQEDSPITCSRLFFHVKELLHIGILKVECPLVLIVVFFDVTDEFQVVHDFLESLRRDPHESSRVPERQNVVGSCVSLKVEWKNTGFCARIKFILRFPLHLLKTCTPFPDTMLRSRLLLGIPP